MMCNTEIRDICNNVNNKASTIIKLSSHVINYPLHKYFFCSTSPARIPHRKISIDSTLEADIAVTWHQSQFCRLMRSRVRIVPNLQIWQTPDEQESSEWDIVWPGLSQTEEEL